MTQTSVPRYASPVDYDSYGTYGPGRGFNKGAKPKRPKTSPDALCLTNA